MSPRSRKPYWAAHVPVSARRPAVRRSAVALLAASALTGGYALAAGPISAQLGTVARECDAPQAMRQLAAARQTRTETRALLAELRTTGATDPRAAALSQQISDLGFTPARYSGWRQKAVDVSDQLHGTTDPALHKVAVELARAGLGPTPADLLGQDPPPAPGPGPISDLGQSLGQAADDTLGGAVDAAGEAAKNAAPKPAPSAAGQGATKEKTEKKKQAQPALPQTCLDTSAAPASTPKTDRLPAPSAPAQKPPTAVKPTAGPAVAGTAAPTAAAPPAPAAATPAPAVPQADPPEDETTAIPLPSKAPAPGGDSSSESPSDSSDSDSSSESFSNTDDTGESSSSDTTESGASSGDIEDARAAIQLLGELMQALGASGDINAADLAQKLQQALPAGTGGAGGPDTEQSSTPEPSADTNTDDTGGSDTGVDQDSDAGGGETGAGNDGSGDAGAGGTTPTDRDSDTASGWQPQAEKLAEQVNEAASTDPLAQQLADKLEAAGIDAGSGSESTGSGSSDNGGGDSSTGGDDSTGQDGTSQGSGKEDSSTAPSSGGGADESQGSGDQGGGESGGDKSGGESEQDSAGDSSTEQASGGGDSGEQSDTADGSGDSGSTEDTPTGDGASDQESSSGGEQSGGEQSGGEQSGGDSGEEQTGEQAGAQPRDPRGADAAPAADTGAGATDTATWDELAECESSGDWSTDSGNGYKGGLQFDPATWEAFGGKGDAAQASKEEQIAVAEKVLDEQGWNAWPSCSKKVLTEQERNMGR